MGLIKEPKGIDLVVGPAVLTEHDKKFISEIIANYKRTGKLPLKSSTSLRIRSKKRQATKVAIRPETAR